MRRGKINCLEDFTAIADIDTVVLDMTALDAVLDLEDLVDHLLED